MSTQPKPAALQLADRLMHGTPTWTRREAAAELRRLHALNQELLDALKRVMDVDCPLNGDPSHKELVEHWEYEKTQGRGEADDRLFALAAIAKADTAQKVFPEAVADATI